MKPKIKKLWVDALRSGEYKQGKNALCTIEDDGTKSYCCLGVLVDLYQNSGEEKLAEEITDSAQDKKIIAYNKFGVLPPQCVLVWAGLPKENPNVTFAHADVTNLAELNDRYNLDFKQIADVIEESL